MSIWGTNTLLETEHLSFVMKKYIDLVIGLFGAKTSSLCESLRVYVLQPRRAHCVQKKVHTGHSITWLSCNVQEAVHM